MMISTINKKRPSRVVGADPVWVGFLLNRAALRIRTETVAALGPLGITPPHLRALEAIAREPLLSQTNLGERVRMDRSTIVHVVDHFEALGIASREADPCDRRAHAVMLTEKGEILLAEAQQRARDVEDDFLGGLSIPERETLRDLLCKLFEPSPCPEEKTHEPGPPPPHP